MLDKTRCGVEFYRLRFHGFQNWAVRLEWRVFTLGSPYLPWYAGISVKLFFYIKVHRHTVVYSIITHRWLRNEIVNNMFFLNIHINHVIYRKYIGILKETLLK